MVPFLNHAISDFFPLAQCNISWKMKFYKRGSKSVHINWDAVNARIFVLYCLDVVIGAGLCFP